MSRTSIVVLTLRASKRRIVYSSLSFALFLFLVGIYWIGTHVSFLPDVGTLIMIASIVTSILLFLDLYPWTGLSPGVFDT